MSTYPPPTPTSTSGWAGLLPPASPTNWLSIQEPPTPISALPNVNKTYDSSYDPLAKTHSRKTSEDLGATFDGAVSKSSGNNGLLKPATASSLAKRKNLTVVITKKSINEVKMSHQIAEN